MAARDHISEKIDLLFRTVRGGSNREYTYDEVEQGTSGRVSRSYVWKLRHGKNTNPSLDVLEALSQFFRVPPDYFFGTDSEGDSRRIGLASIAAILDDPAARAVAEQARGLSTQSLEAVGRLLENLHAIERTKTWMEQTAAASAVSPRGAEAAAAEVGNDERAKGPARGMQG